MSDFLDYYKKEEEKRVMTEEERFALHKKQKEIEKQRRQLSEDDELYDNDDVILEGVRIPNKRYTQMPVRPNISPESKPVQKPQEIINKPRPKPVIRPEQTIKPITRPQPTKPVEDPFNKIEKTANTMEIINRRHKQEITESTNPALTEAYNMMNDIHHKIENMFYRYGMSGLEKINNNIEAFFESVINPTIKEEIVESVPTVKKVIKKKVSKPVLKTTKSLSTSEVKKLSEKNIATNPEAIQKKFEDVNNNIDIAALGASLIEQQKDSILTEKTINTLNKINAQAKLMQERIEKSTTKTEATNQLEENLVQEELDVVDDETINPAVDALNEAMNEPEIIPEPTTEN